MNEDQIKEAEAAIIGALCKLYQVVLVHRSYTRPRNQFTKGTLEAGREALKDLPRPIEVTGGAVALLAKKGWGAEECCRNATALLQKARVEASEALLEMKVTAAEMLALGDEAPTKKLWRDIAKIDVALRELGKPGFAARLARKTWTLANKVRRELERMSTELAV